MGHEQVKITERFVLTSDVDPKSVEVGTGYFFERNKAAMLKKAEAAALVEQEEKEQRSEEEKKEEKSPVRLKIMERKASVAEPLLKIDHEEAINKKKPDSIKEKLDDADDDVEKDDVDDFQINPSKKNSLMAKLSDPVFDMCLVVGIGLALFALYKVSSSRFKIRKAVDSIRGDTRDN